MAGQPETKRKKTAIEVFVITQLIDAIHAPSPSRVSRRQLNIAYNLFHPAKINNYASRFKLA